MDWWNNFVDWADSSQGWRLISGAIIPFVAIVVAGVVAALIGRGATKRVLTLQERESKNAAVGGIITAARKAATWGVLGHDERSYADHLAEDADIRLRLLPVQGAAVAANWAQHEILDIKKNSSTFSFQAEQSLAEFRDRMLEWQARPSKARKLFRYDLERWKFETPDGDAELVKRQQQWNADQTTPAASTPTAAAPTTTSLRPSPAQPTTPIGSGAAAPAAAPLGSTRPGGATSAAPTAADPNATTPYARPNAAATGSAATGRTSDRGGESSAGTLPGAAADLSAGTDSSAGADSSATADRGDGADRTDAPGRGDGADRNSDRSGEQRSGSASRVPGYGTAVGTAGAQRPASAPMVAPSPSSAPSSSATEVVGDDDRDGHPTTELSDTKVDAAAAPTNTTSIPTRIADAPAEPADPDETKESPYASPLSASELRRRSEDDDE